MANLDQLAADVAKARVTLASVQKAHDDASTAWEAARITWGLSVPRVVMARPNFPTPNLRAPRKPPVHTPVPIPVQTGTPDLNPLATALYTAGVALRAAVEAEKTAVAAQKAAMAEVGAA